MLTDKPGTEQRGPYIPLGVQLLTFAAFVPQANSGVDTRNVDYYRIVSFKQLLGHGSGW